MALRRGALSDTDSLKPLGGRASVTRLLRVFVTVPALGAVLVFGAPSAAAFPTPDSGPVTGGTTVTVPVPGADSFLQVSAGYLHSLAVDADGNVWAWGSDASGQIGNGATTGNVATPTQVTTGTTFTAVAAGISHSLALDADGNLWAWGNDSYAQLGNGAATGDVTTPTQITTGTTFTAIATGYYHSLALDAGGNLWTWGADHFGQVGNGATTGAVSTPTRLTLGTRFTAIAGGYVHSLAVDADGNLWTWGFEDHGQLGNGAPTGVIVAPAQITAGTTFTAVAASRDHSVAVDADGNLWSWGYDFLGVLGNGAATGTVTVPAQITTGTRYTAIATGYYHSVALDADGDLWTWGRYHDGVLGNGATTGIVTAPAQITTGTRYTAVAAGYKHSLALDADGYLWTWGDSEYGQVGNGSTTGDVTAPTRLTTGTSFTASAAGSKHSLAVDAYGNLWGWGRDNLGQVGNGATTGDVITPTQITIGTSFTAIATGDYHSLALDAGGNLWTWGADPFGQLGNGTTTADVITPTQITTGATFTAIATGYYHSLALDAGGNLWAWGLDEFGQVGNGAIAGYVTTPTQITTGTSFTAIATGYYHSLALDAGGNLWTWGHNVVGQLGNGTAHGTVTTPTQIATGTTFTAIAGGGVYSLALDADGDLWTWGNDGHGQLGNGAATGDVTTPTQITSGTSFTNLKGGRVHSLALDADGNLWTWGSDDSGELGNGAATGDVTTPTQITTGTSFTALEGGDWYSLALDADGNLWTWGRDDTGQLGNGAAAGVVTTPTRIGGTTTVTGIAFDGVPGTNLQRLSETRALVTTPAGAAGPATITIQYTYDGAAKPALTLTPAFTYIAAAPTTGTDSDTGSSGSGGTTSGRAAFVGQASVGQASVGQAPAITLHPSDATANAGDSFTLTVQADGDPTPDIRWQVSTDSGLTWTDVAGETGSSLTLTASEEVDGNHYRAVATNDQGTATSDAAILTVEPTTVATASPSPTPSATPSPSPTETTEPTGDDSSSGIPAWVWIGGGTTLLLLLLALAAAAAQRRQT